MSQDYKPMIGLNVYLEPQFRKEVIEKVYSNLPALSDELRRELSQVTKDELKVVGFRNPMIAPKALLVKAAVSKFEKESRFLKLILQCWAYQFSEHHEETLAKLKDLGFEVAETAPVYGDPENAFEAGWPEEVNYEKLDQALKENPKNTLTSDENALLSIWLTGRLP